MRESDDREHGAGRALAGSAMLLVQMAAGAAEIGPFARRGRETPQAAALSYRLASRLAPARISGRG